MKLEHSFSVPVPVEHTWAVLLDINKIAPCMPGATIESVDGDAFTGTVDVKLGPIKMKYRGNAAFTEKDARTHRAVIDARGRDSHGNGTAAATITALCVPTGNSTRVDVVTDLNITGKPAQFGRSVMVDVGDKLIGQFADSLARRLADGDITRSTEHVAAGTVPIDLLDAAGPAALKRLIPAAVIAAAVLLAAEVAAWRRR